VRWQLSEVSFFDVADVTITTTSAAWNSIISVFHGPIVSVVKSLAIPKIEATIKAIVDDLNTKLASRDPAAFMVNIFDPRFPLNLLTARPPTAEPDT
jgi:hypothetical protein